MFARNLNIFLGCLIGFSSIGAWILIIPLSLLLRPFVGEQRASIIGMPLAYMLIALILAYAWWAGRLSPAQRAPGSNARFRAGHQLLAFGNLTVLATLGAQFVLPQIAKVAPITMAGGVLLFLMPMGMIAIIAGPLLVWSTRARVPAPAADQAFADTVIEARPGQLRAGRVTATTPVSRLSVTLPVILGLLASCFLVFMGAVFAGAAAGNSGSGKLFVDTAVPVMLVGLVLYLTTTIWLVWRRHDKSALGLAWGPVLLLVVAAPLMQILQTAVWLFQTK